MTASPLLIESFFEDEDPRFFSALLHCAKDAWLGDFARRWYRDERPFARSALLDYIDEGCDRAGHRAMVKHLFKDAEANEDDEAMVHFMVAFDKWVRREWRESSWFDWRTNSYTNHSYLARDPNIPMSRRHAEGGGRFSHRTRLYLCRRVFRYFRTRGYKDKVRYRDNALAALRLYRDEHFPEDANIADAWGLLYICYRHSEIVYREPRGVDFINGKEAADLVAAPIFPEAWDDALEGFVALVGQANSAFVRRWATEVIGARAEAAAASLPIGLIGRLLGSFHPEAQRLGARLLSLREDLDALSLQFWLDALALTDPIAASTLIALVEAHVSPAELTLEESVNLSCVGILPIAELALSWVQARAGQDAGELIVLSRLAEAKAQEVRERAVAWLVQRMAAQSEVPAESVRDLVDSTHRDVRKHGMRLMFGDERFRYHTGLWVALAESTFGDVRDTLLDALAEMESELDPSALRHVWASALLDVHRGSHKKRLALRLLTEQLVGEPAHADDLLPLIEVALRSVRANERRGALVQLTRAAARDEAFKTRLVERFPELSFGEEVV